MAIVPAQSVSHFFDGIVTDAMRSQRVHATEGATRYLVALLADYAHPDARAGQALDRPLTLLLDEALRALDAGERFERLRTLGDGVLYGCGFFGDHFASRGVDPTYLRGLGTRAYGAASGMLRQGGDAARKELPDLFEELADNFGQFVEVLSDVADSTVAMSADSSTGLLKAYERWLKTGSDRLAGALASRGVVPTRGAPGGLH
ncbi:MAG: hypothetical protein ACRENE_16085 [Polyangiaceae bacterium]